jgi:hypothetical protein
MRVLPFLASILSNPHQQMPGLVVGALDLLSMLLEKAPVEIIRAAYDVSFSPLIRIALQSNDQSELQVSFIFLLCVQHLLFFEKS